MQAYLHIATPQEIQDITAVRLHEEKLGQHVQTCKSTDAERLSESLKASDARYVVMGIPEDIGVRANGGRAGAASCWNAALRSLLNIQHNDFLHGNDLLVLGYLDCGELMEEAAKDGADLRELVSRIDTVLSAVVQTVIASGKELIVIGGGHNNSYGCLRGTAQALGHAVHCINADAHSDYRPKEGRHSGNGFRYAREENYLDRYAILGLHESYASQAVLSQLRADEGIQFSLFEDVFVRKNMNFEQVLNEHIAFVAGNDCGVELDLDAIENMASSAISPTGMTANDARRFVHRCAETLSVKYLHLAEGAPSLSGIKDDQRVGKLIAYLVADFIKARNTYHTKK